jgi:hypothetical protein
VQLSPRGGFRLRVGHLLVWTLGCAVGFAAYRWLTPPWPMPTRTRALSGAYNLLMGVAFGTLLAGAGVLAYRRGRGDRSCPSCGIVMRSISTSRSIRSLKHVV